MKTVCKAIGYYMDFRYERETTVLGYFSDWSEAKRAVQRHDATRDKGMPEGKIEEFQVYDTLEEQIEARTAGTAKAALSKLTREDKEALKLAGYLKEDAN